MVRSRRVSLRPLVVLGALCLACSGDPYGPAEPKKDPAGKAPEAKVADPGKAEAKAVPQPKTPKIKAVPDKHEDGKPLGKLLDGVALPVAKLLGEAPPKVESFLGPPLPDQKGGMRKSCVRYIPDRTWFHCEQAWQRYSDKTGTFGVVHVIYEDGKATALSFEKIPGQDSSSPSRRWPRWAWCCRGRPRLENPSEGVTVWSWFNPQARLIIHGRQYRVRVSTVGGKWETSKVEIILNDVLNESEKPRVFTPGGKGDTGSAAKAPKGGAGSDTKAG